MPEAFTFKKTLYSLQSRNIFQAAMNFPITFTNVCLHTLNMICFVSGPPQADQKEVKKIGRIGETVKIVCPIGGYPAPMIEWTKNGEKIDYMWDRHRTGKKSLKIKHVNADDTGIFTCKGVKTVPLTCQPDGQILCFIEFLFQLSLMFTILFRNQRFRF